MALGLDNLWNEINHKQNKMYLCIIRIKDKEGVIVFKQLVNLPPYLINKGESQDKLKRKILHLMGGSSCDIIKIHEKDIN